jgi:hypothetical protein
MHLLARVRTRTLLAQLKAGKQSSTKQALHQDKGFAGSSLSNGYTTHHLHLGLHLGAGKSTKHTLMCTAMVRSLLLPGVQDLSKSLL